MLEGEPATSTTTRALPRRMLAAERIDTTRDVRNFRARPARRLRAEHDSAQHPGNYLTRRCYAGAKAWAIKSAGLP